MVLSSGSAPRYPGQTRHSTNSISPVKQQVVFRRPVARRYDCHRGLARAGSIPGRRATRRLRGSGADPHRIRCSSRGLHAQDGVDTAKWIGGGLPGMRIGLIVPVHHHAVFISAGWQGQILHPPALAERNHRCRLGPPVVETPRDPDRRGSRMGEFDVNGFGSGFVRRFVIRFFFFHAIIFLWFRFRGGVPAVKEALPQSSLLSSSLPGQGVGAAARNSAEWQVALAVDPVFRRALPSSATAYANGQ